MSERITLLADALHYAHPLSGASTEKAQGVVIGAMSVLMGTLDIGFEEAAEIARQHLPDPCREDAIPAEWRDELLGK